MRYNGLNKLSAASPVVVKRYEMFLCQPCLPAGRRKASTGAGLKPTCFYFVGCCVSVS